jgi:hypothetical protein
MEDERDEAAVLAEIQILQDEAKALQSLAGEVQREAARLQAEAQQRIERIAQLLGEIRGDSFH